MKYLSCLSLVLGLMLLTACESTSTSNGPTAYQPMGAQARTTVEIPASPAGTTDIAQPYALQGAAPASAEPAPMMGYQGRN